MFGTFKKHFHNAKRSLGKLDPHEVAEQSLSEARLALLEAQDGMDYSRAMTEYHQRRITRLEKYVAQRSEGFTQSLLPALVPGENVKAITKGSRR